MRAARPPIAGAGLKQAFREPNVSLSRLRRDRILRETRKADAALRLVRQ